MTLHQTMNNQFKRILIACLLMIVFTCPANAQTNETPSENSAATASSPQSAQSPHQQLDEVLQDPLFQRWEARQLRGQGPDEASKLESSDSLKRFRTWLEDTTDSFFDWLFRNRQSSTSTSGSGGSGIAIGPILKTLGWVIGILAVILVIHLLLTWIRAQRRITNRGTPTHQSLRAALETGTALAAAPDQWLNHAQDLAASGDDHQDLRLAFRALYLALLSGLHEQGRIRFRKQRTNWVYVQQFQGPPKAMHSFGQLTEWFDTTWYGHQSPEASVFKQVRGKVDQLLKGGDPSQK